MNSPLVRINPEFNKLLEDLKEKWGVKDKSDLTAIIARELNTNIEFKIVENKKTKTITVKPFSIKLLQ
jgi:hypothetical protein